MDKNTTSKERLFDFFLSFLQVAENDVKNTSNFEKDFRKRLKFQKDTDWKKFRASIDLLEDTELALRSAFAYQLGDLNNNNDDFGEIYLRLYGVLNAVYLQMAAYEEISTLINYKSRKDIKKSFRKLDIYQLRGMAGAHTVNYEFDKDFSHPVNKKTSFRIIQSTIERTGKKIKLWDENDIEFEFSLLKVLLEYERNATTLLIELISHSIKRFINKKDQRSSFQDNLNKFQKELIDYSHIDKNKEYWNTLYKEMDEEIKNSSIESDCDRDNSSHPNASSKGMLKKDESFKNVIVKKANKMIKTFDLQDESFYKLLNSEIKDFYLKIKDAKKAGLKPMVKITNSGHRTSWYNKHIGKSYEIDRYIVETDNGYINFLVKSGEDGTKKGYKPTFSNFNKGPGYDIVHNVRSEVEFAKN